MFSRDDDLSHVKWVLPHAYVHDSINPQFINVHLFLQPNYAGNGKHGHGDAVVV